MSIIFNQITKSILRLLLFAGSWAGLIIPIAAFSQTSSISPKLDTSLLARVPSLHAGTQKQIHKNLLPHTINMDDAVKIAINNNLHVKVAIAQTGIAFGELQHDAQIDNPFIEGEFERDPEGKNAFTITAKQDITSLLFAGIKIRALASGRNEAVLKATGDIYTLIGTVKRAYVRVSLLHKVVDLDVAEMSAAEAAASMAQRQLSAGNINQLDNVEYRWALHRMRVEYQHAVTELQVATGELHLTLGLVENDTMPNIVTLAQPPLLAMTEDQLVDAALHNRLDLVALESSTERLHIQRKAIRAESFGSIEAGIGANYENGRFAQVYPVVGVRVPLWSQNKGKRMAVNSTIEKTAYEVAALKREIPVVVRDAAKEYMHKRVAMSLLDTMATERALIVELAQKHYNVMTMGVYDLLETKQQEIAAKRELARAELDAWIAYVNLEQTVGIALETNQP